MNLPLVSIILPVYNTEKFLRKSIQSILSQTYRNIELIIVNDGSKDHSEEIVLSFNDPRIKYFKNETNLGLIQTLNNAILRCTGKYIARMDADDIALPERITLQARFLEKLGHHAIVGTNIVLINQDNAIIKIPRKMNTKADENFWAKYRKCPMAHPTVMMSKEVATHYNPFYSPEAKHIEDYHAWLRTNDLFPIYNLSTPLLLYRVHQGSISGNNYDTQKNKTTDSLMLSFFEKTGVTLSREAIETLLYLRMNPNQDHQKIFKEIHIAAKVFASKFGSERFIMKDLAYAFFSIGLKAGAKNLLSTVFFIIKKLGILPLIYSIKQTAIEGMRATLGKIYYKFKFSAILRG